MDTSIQRLVTAQGDRPRFDLFRQLPPAPELVGRDTDIAELEAALSSGGAVGAAIFGRHAGLQGMGGVGKTALAVALAWRLSARFPDPPIFLSLNRAEPRGRSPLTPVAAMQSIIHCFQPEAALAEEAEALDPLYRAVLDNAGRGCLLVLDNASGPEQIAPLLPPPNCRLLVTSRQPINLPGLIPRKLDALLPVKSSELLMRLAPRFGGLVGTAAELCGHLPLTLEVLAAIVNRPGLFPLNQLLSRLRTYEERLAPVDAAFAASCDLLNPALFRRWLLLAIFPTSFDLEAAAALWQTTGAAGNPITPSQPEPDTFPITGDDRSAMQALVEAKLVECHTTAGRYRLHGLAQEFAISRLTAEEVEPGRLRHAMHYAAVAERMDTLRRASGEQALQGLAVFDCELPNFEAAFDFLLPMCSRRLRPGRSVADLHTACRQMVRIGGPIAHIGPARLNRLDRLRWNDALRNAAHETDDDYMEAYALSNLGPVYAEIGKMRHAMECYDQHIELARDLGDRAGEAAALWNSARLLDKNGERANAISRAETALKVCEKIEFPDVGNVRSQLKDWRGGR